jgi:hypothetical protein
MVDAVAPNEPLARYIVYSKWIRNSDHTIKPNAFIPPDTDLSVTRHLQLTEESLWKIGSTIASGMHPKRSLYGRADVEAHSVFAQNLKVLPDPVEPDNRDHPNHNPNHANITNWPLEKDVKKMCALEIAKAASFVENPNL